MTSIASQVTTCFESFQTLIACRRPESQSGDDRCEQFQTIGAANEFSVPRIKDEMARFKVWAANIGAHRNGRSSLDYRVRDTSKIRIQVLQLLEDLSESLSAASSICRGERTPWDEEPELGDAETDTPPGLPEIPSGLTELSQISTDITEIVDCLFRLSISIRNARPHDRFKKAHVISTTHFEESDIRHVDEVFPSAPESLKMLLGKAISRRRQFFKYRELHRRKLGFGLEESDNIDEAEATTVASSLPVEMNSGFLELENAHLDVLNEDGGSEAGWTDTSCGSSAVGGADSKIPPLPKEAGEQPFECPFCYTIISVSTTKAWIKHVLADLRPYVCLLPECTSLGSDFGGRRHWVRHILNHHWRVWTCILDCGLVCESEDEMRAHLVAKHVDSLGTKDIDALVEMSEGPKPRDVACSCPLCHQQLGSLKEYARHVGRHQRDLSLFALPKLDGEEEADDDERNTERQPNPEQNTPTESDVSDAESISSSEKPSEDPPHRHRVTPLSIYGGFGADERETEPVEEGETLPLPTSGRDRVFECCQCAGVVLFGSPCGEPRADGGVCGHDCCINCTER
ncbi:hypothetical protein QBC34DRAFT_324536 [Podospora aff. communis PSN243]|uniref:C2H2-type domain-containing protein n=1 Tax=Podospora aff. communis PSN243 TaxID=3040156 RepID=A0AAV9GSD5_9PEZI|nr:hypothetical protein QBC34DRAFT_324536 [Podospora aff. communis PSN243]